NISWANPDEDGRLDVDRCVALDIVAHAIAIFLRREPSSHPFSRAAWGRLMARIGIEAWHVARRPSGRGFAILVSSTVLKTQHFADSRLHGYRTRGHVASASPLRWASALFWGPSLGRGLCHATRVTGAGGKQACPEAMWPPRQWGSPSRCYGPRTRNSGTGATVRSVSSNTITGAVGAAGLIGATTIPTDRNARPPLIIRVRRHRCRRNPRP